MVKEIKIYLASPLGFSELGKYGLYKKLIPSIEELTDKNIVFKILDPWKLTPQEVIDSVTALPFGEERREKWKEVNMVIAENNEHAIKECTLIVAVLDGADVDSGTAGEIGFGYAIGKPIIGYRGDFRMMADNEGSIVNLQIEYFIRKSGGTIVDTIEKLQNELKKYANTL